MKLLNDEDMNLFLGRPDTTAVTQLLDQINHSLHDTYRTKQKEEFLSHETSNRKGFINILGSIWKSWMNKDSIINAAKRVGISSKG